MIYFSEREQGERPRVHNEITPVAWKGIAAEISRRIDDGSFGAKYPLTCFDAPGACIGTDRSNFWNAMKGRNQSLPDAPWDILDTSDPDSPNLPSTLTAMDVIQFCWKVVGKPEQHGYHERQHHWHLTFGKEAGREEFRSDVNDIFRCNGLAFELTERGQVQRLVPPVLRKTLVQAMFSTGDTELDEMLETARQKFLDPDEKVRREALEKLWDAFERLKTQEPGEKKPAQIQALLDRVADPSSAPNFRKMLDCESRGLTDIGNRFQIRHSETCQERLPGSDEMDYLFHRLFSFMWLVLRATDRGE